MNINSSQYIKNNIQSVEAFKFFQNSVKRKTSPESKENKPIMSKLPRRSARLKSVIHVESFKDLLNSEYDITKEDFNSSIQEIGALERKTRLPKPKSNKINDILNRIDMHLGSTVESKSPNMKVQDNTLHTQEAVDELINSVDTDAIANFVNNYERTEESRNTARIKNGETNESSTLPLDDSLYKSDCVLNENTDSPTIKQAPLKATVEVSSQTVLQDNNQRKNTTVAIQQKKRGRKPRNLNNNSTSNGNGILNYFKVQDNKQSNACISFEYNEQKVQNSGQLPNNTSNNENLQNLKKSEKPTGVSEKVNDREEKQNLPESNEVNNSQPNKRQPNKNEAISNNTEINNSQPKKRGRPPKKAATVTENAQIKNSEPKKRGRPPKKIEAVTKINQTNKAQLKEIVRPKPKKLKMISKKHTISKVTKKQIKTVNTKKIPKDRLMDVLDMIDNDNHLVWQDRNASCNQYIYHHWEPRISTVSDQNAKLKYARQFLLRRDWISLSKILCCSHSASITYYPLLAKYAALLLAHTDKDQFDKLIQLLTRVTDTSIVMKRCTNIVKEIDE